MNINIKKNVSRDIYPARYYLNLKSLDFDKWKERWECMLWEKKEEYSHLAFEDFAESEFCDRGFFFKLHQTNNLDLLKATDEDINESSVWVIPGALSTSRLGMQKTLEYTNRFLSINCFEYWNGRSIIFCPYSTGKQRYMEDIEYNDDPHNYYTTNIEKFVRKYLIPHIIKEKKISFITYSIGGKELAIIENAMRNIFFNEYNYSLNNTEKLFKLITAFCIGYAPDIDNLPNLRFNKVTLLSASDQGLFIPKSLYLKIYKPEICSSPFNIFKVDKYEELVFLGHQTSVEVFNGKLNHDGHRLPHYLEAISNGIPKKISKYLYSKIFDNYHCKSNISSDLAKFVIEI